MIVTFTGPHKPVASKGDMQGYIEDALTGISIEEAEEFRSGAAHNIDTLAYRMAAYVFPHARHRVFVPCGKTVDEKLWHNTEVVVEASEECHEIINVTGGYLKRDDAMVEGADLLLAFPNSMNEQLRSGTWATIRRAWKRDVEVRYFPLDGKPGPVVRCT